MDGQAELTRRLVIYLDSSPVYRQSPIQVLTEPGVEQFRWSNTTSAHFLLEILFFFDGIKTVQFDPFPDCLESRRTAALRRLNAQRLSTTLVCCVVPISRHGCRTVDNHEILVLVLVYMVHTLYRTDAIHSFDWKFSKILMLFVMSFRPGFWGNIFSNKTLFHL